MHGKTMFIGDVGPVSFSSPGVPGKHTNQRVCDTTEIFPAMLCCTLMQKDNHAHSGTLDNVLLHIRV
jgi:hypothetical protein